VDWGAETNIPNDFEQGEKGLPVMLGVLSSPQPTGYAGQKWIRTATLNRPGSLNNAWNQLGQGFFNFPKLDHNFRNCFTSME
jgi:hypothetical protein